MSRPTDAELNIAMAEVIWGCAHLDLTRNARGWTVCRHCGAEMEHYPFPPKFCTDRNNLPAVYAAVDELSGVWRQHMYTLIPKSWREEWEITIAEPRLQVIAALRALGRWPENWTLTE